MASLLEQVKEQEAIREDIKIEQKKRKKVSVFAYLVLFFGTFVIITGSFFFFKQHPLHNFHLSNYPAAQPIIARARRVIKPDSKIVAPDPSPEATIIIHYNSPLPIPLLIPADVIAAAPTLPRRKSCVHISCPPITDLFYPS